MRTFALLATAAMFGAGAAMAQTSSESTSGTATASVNSPQEFVEKAAISNMFEIQSSELALEMSENEDIQAFAEQMVEDHTAAGEELKAAVEAQGGDLQVPTELDTKHQDMIDQLSSASGEEFDQMYVEMQTQAHEQAVSLFESYAENGEGELQAFAEATLPTLQEHYEMIQQMGQQ